MYVNLVTGVVRKNVYRYTGVASQCTIEGCKYQLSELLSAAINNSEFVLGMARSLGWKVHMRCASGYRESTRSMRRCVYRPRWDGAVIDRRLKAR